MSRFEHAEPDRKQGTARHGAPAARSAPVSAIRAGDLSTTGLLALQRSIGNRAVARLLASPASSTRTVQRAGVQDVLTDKHWADAAKGKPNVGYFPEKNSKEKKANDRMLIDILQTVGPGLLAELQQVAGDNPEADRELKLYRTMNADDANAILDWQGSGKKGNTEQWIGDHSGAGAGIAKTFKTESSQEDAEIGVIPIRKHLGDLAQATEYFEKGGSSSAAPKRILEFTLKPGAHELLFSPKYMAVHGDKGAPQAIRNHFGEADKFKEASANEGARPGYIGMKKETHGDFSLSLGDTDITALLFQLFVKTVRDATPGAE